MFNKSASQQRGAGTARPWTMDECRQKADEGGYFERVLIAPSAWLVDASLDEFWRSVAASICEEGIPLYDMTFTILDGEANYNRIRVRVSIDPKANTDGGYAVNSKKPKALHSSDNNQEPSMKEKERRTAKSRQKKGGERIDGQTDWLRYIRVSEEA